MKEEDGRNSCPFYSEGTNRSTNKKDRVQVRIKDVCKGRVLRTHSRDVCKGRVFKGHAKTHGSRTTTRMHINRRAGFL